MFDNPYVSAGLTALSPWLGAANYARQIFDPNINLIPGIGPNEAKRNAVPNKPAPVKAPAAQLNDAPDTPLSSADAYSTYGSGGGGGGGRTSADIAADLAYLDDQEGRLRRQQGSTDIAERNGITSLNDSFNQETSKANDQRSRALEDFALKREDTTRSKDTALNRVNSNARSLADSLRRRIGMASGSGSSAYQITAPGAVANEASSNRGEVQENYGVNFRNLGMAEDRAKSDFESLLQDLASQRSQRESDFRSGILDKKNQIDTSLSEIARQRALAKGGGYAQVRSAMAPYASAIDSRQGEIDSLFDRFRTPYNVKPVNVQTPELRKYTVDNAEIGQQTAAGDPYAEALRKKQTEDDTYNPLLG